MKLEILLKNIDCIEQVNNIHVDNTVSINKNVNHGLCFFVYELQGDTLVNAKVLSEIYESYVEKKIDCYIATNEASEFFNISLYPLFNKFERNLRKLIYILAVKSEDNEIIRFANRIDCDDFYCLMSFLFNNGHPLKAIKKRNYSSDFVQAVIEQTINELPKKSLWTYFISEESFISKNYLQLVHYRDIVMHADNINYEKYATILLSIEEANREIELLLLEYTVQSIYLPVPFQKVIKNFNKQLIKNNPS